ARTAGQDEVVVETVTANRGQPELAELVGPFVNTLALRMPVDLGGSFESLLGVARRVAVEAFARQEVPFDRVVEAVAPARDVSRTPIFETVLVRQNMPMPELELRGLAAQAMPVTTDSVDVDVM